MKNILITGGSGLLGQYINITASTENKILTIYNNNKGNCAEFNCVRADISDINMLKEIFINFKPSVIIHTAALTNPVIKDGQSTKDYFYINVTATKNLAELCNIKKAKLIYISTDLVYAGYRGSFLKEDAKLIPASLYAETKLLAEVKIRESTDDFIILRTALLYGIGLNHSRCHFQYMNNELRKGKPVKLFTDQFRTPISLNDTAKIITEIAKKEVKDEIVNLAGTERISRYELGEILCLVAGYDKSLLQKITLDEVHRLPKVEDVSLNTEKLQSIGFKTRSIEENISEFVKTYK